MRAGPVAGLRNFVPDLSQGRRDAMGCARVRRSVLGNKKGKEYPKRSVELERSVGHYRRSNIEQILQLPPESSFLSSS